MLLFGTLGIEAAGTKLQPGGSGAGVFGVGIGGVGGAGGAGVFGVGVGGVGGTIHKQGVRARDEMHKHLTLAS